LEKAVIGGLVAQVEGERFFLLGGRAIAREGQVLEANSALAKPVMLGHALDEDFFGGSGGLVFAAERIEEVIVEGSKRGACRWTSCRFGFLEFSLRVVVLIRGRPVDAVDNQNLHRPLCRHKFKAEPSPYRVENSRASRVREPRFGIYEGR